MKQPSDNPCPRCPLDEGLALCALHRTAPALLVASREVLRRLSVTGKTPTPLGAALRRLREAVTYAEGR